MKHQSFLNKASDIAIRWEAEDAYPTCSVSDSGCGGLYLDRKEAQALRKELKKFIKAAKSCED